MMTFITILAVIFLVFSSIQIWATYLDIRDNKNIINLANAAGANIEYDVYKWPVFRFVLSAVWLISLWID